MDKCSFSLNNRYFTWVLVPREEPDTLDFLSSCKTRVKFLRSEGYLSSSYLTIDIRSYRRSIIIEHDSGVKEAAGYGIASVFTPPNFRGKGYGTHMMRLLHWVLALHELLPRFPLEIWGPPPSQTLGDAAVSVLYSDVGGFYERCGPTLETLGWILTARYSTIWPVNSEKTASQPTQVRWLDQHSLVPLLHQDDRLITKDLAISSAGEPRFTFLPGDNQVEFQIKRYLLSFGDAEIEYPKCFGVAVPEPSSRAPDSKLEGEEPESKLVYGAWTFELKPELSRLIIYRLRATLESFPAILAVALSEARKAGAEIVEVWNLPSEFEKVVGETGGKTIEREDHWPCVAWYGIRDTLDSINWKQIIKWDNNEK